MSLPPSRSAETASETGPSSWPPDFEARWHQLRQAVRHQDVQSLSSWLTDCQRDPEDWQKQWFLAQLCGALPGPGAIAALEALDLLATEPQVRVEVLRGWREQGHPGLARLRQAIVNPQDRGWALEALAGSEKPPLLALLVMGLEAEDARWRAEAARALGHTQDPTLAANLNQLIHDDAATVRRAVVEAVRFCPALDETARQQLLEVGLRDGNPEVAREAVWALAQQHRWDVLTTVVSHPSAARSAALAALASTDDAAALAHLTALEAVDWPASLWTPLLASLGQSPFPEPISRWLVQWAPQCPCRQELIYCLGRLGAGAIARPLLEQWLQSCQQPGERLSLQQALQRLEN